MTIIFFNEKFKLQLPKLNNLIPLINDVIENEYNCNGNNEISEENLQENLQ